MAVFQTQKKGYSTPAGLKLETIVDGGSAYDLGVMADGMTWTHTYEAPEIENGNAEDPPLNAKNQSVTISPTAFRTWETEALEQISGGLITRQTVAGTLVAGAEQTLASGSWEETVGYEIDGKNADGSAPTINSVTGSSDGLLTEDVDYSIVKVSGGWAISLFGAGVTTTAQAVVIDYDYTPAAGSYLFSGSASQELVPFILRARHYTDDLYTLYDYEVVFFKTNLTPGSLALTKAGGLGANTVDEWVAEFTASPDGDLESKKQLFRIYQGDPISA